MKMVVDPYIVIVPTGTDITKDDVLEWVERFVMWNVDFPKAPEGYFMSETVRAAMEEESVFPYFHNVDQLFRRYGIVEYDPHDVGVKCGTNLDSMSYLEEYCGVDDNSVSSQCIKVEDVLPPRMKARLPEKISTSFAQTLINCDVALAKNGESNASFALATSVEWDAPLDEMLVLRASLADGHEHEMFESTWNLIYDPDYINITRRVVDAYQEDLIRALEIVVSKMRVRRELKRNTADFPQFIFGPKFKKSIDALPEFDHRSFRDSAIELCFEAMYRVMVGDWPYNGPFHHKLRAGVGRGDDQKLRYAEGGVDRAVRVRVECRLSEGVQHHLHVHYWQRADGVMEFSNVTYEHDDDTIYE